MINIQNLKKDLKDKSWLEKIAIFIDLMLNPKAPDYPLASHQDGTQVILIRWIKRKNAEPK